MLIGMMLVLGAKSVHAQGTWVPNWVAVDANGNPTSDWSFYGTPTGQGTVTYDPKWKTLGFPSYPFSLDYADWASLYGVTGPNPRSKTFSVSTQAWNGIWSNGARIVTTDAGSVTANEQGDYTLTLLWAPIYQGPSPTPAMPSPPKSINLLINVTGGGGASVSPGLAAYPSDATGSAQVSDSLGDGGSYSVGSTNGWRGPARHLKQVQGSSTITQTIHMTGSSTSSDTDGTSVTYSTSGSGSAGLSAVATLDPRSTSISSSLSPTYYKNTSNLPTMRSPNNADATGTLTDDTVVPMGLFPQPYTCTGAAIGGWAPVGTTYSWSSSPSGGSNSGNYPNIQSFSPIAKSVSDGVTDKVTFKVSDGVDGASESANYCVRYHDPVPKAGWSAPTITAYHPAPIGGPPDIIHIGEWKPDTTLTLAAGGGDATETFQYSASEQDTVSGTIGGGSTTTLTVDQISKAFTENASLTIGVTWTAGIQISTGLDCKAGGTTYIYEGISSDDRTGTCDVYDAHGYEGQKNWNAHVVHQNPAGGSNNASIAWKTVFVSTPK